MIKRRQKGILSALSVLLILPMLSSAQVLQRETNPVKTKMFKTSSQGNETILHGSVIRANGWGPSFTAYGFYSFPVKENTEVTKTKADNTLTGVNGIYADGKYYFSTLYEYSGTLFSLSYYKYSTETYEKEKDKVSYYPSRSDYMTSACTYDPISKKGYAISIDDDKKYRFNSVNLEDGKLTPILIDMPVHLLTLASNSAGILYGISEEGGFYSVDKSNGTTSKIGETGIDPDGSQSMAFSNLTGKLYWCARMAHATSGLYEINIASGNATLISSMPENEQVVGLYVEDPDALPDAPAAVNDLKATFEQGNLEGTISFTVPSKTFSGEALTGMIDISLQIDQETPKTYSAAAGSNFSTPKTMTTGTHTISVKTGNSYGDSPISSISLYIGKDAPVRVSNLTFAKTNDKATLTWDAPTETLHGGFLDKSSLHYKIVRYPGEVTVASNHTQTTFTENLPKELASYYYQVTSYAGDLTGETVSSNKLICGDAIIPPYYVSFDTEEDTDLFTNLTVNSDGNMWEWESSEKAMKYRYSSSYEGTAWFITPPIKLGTDCEYKLSFRLKTSTYNEENLKITLGTANTVESQTTTLLDLNHFVTASGDYEAYTVAVKAPTAGNYYIGFNAYSDPDKYYILLDDIKLEQGASMQGPGAVTNLEAKAAPLGELKATLSFNAPTKKYNGETLNSLSKIEIYKGRETEAIQVFNAPQMGAALSWTDENAIHGMNTYRITGFNNEDGEGESISITVYVGEDIPSAVENLRLIGKADKVEMTWEAPTVGTSGGYLNPENLTYKVYRYNPLLYQYDELGSTKELTFTDENPPLSTEDQQVSLKYAVTVVSSTMGKSAQIEKEVIAGAAYEIPFHESFANAKAATTLWTTKVIHGSQSWALATDADTQADAQDGDNGMAYFGNMDDFDIEGLLQSPIISLKQGTNPALTFWMYHVSGQPAEKFYLEILVSVEGNPFTQIGERIALNNGNEGWNKHLLSLKEYSGKENFQFAFKGYAAGWEGVILVDNVSIENIPDRDMALITFNVPSKMNVNEEEYISVLVRNEGQESDNYNVELYMDGKVVETQNGEKLYSGQEAMFHFPIQTSIFDTGKKRTYQAKIVYAGDNNESNNQSEVKELTIISPTYPVVTNLQGKQIGADVSLSWEEPNTDVKLPITDDIESYKPLIIKNIGAWKLYDGDGQKTYTAEDMDEYDNKRAPMAFQVWNPSYLGVSNKGWKSHSGDQYLISFASSGIMPGDEEPTVDPKNDDWLISPEIVGGSVLSFWSKEATNQYGAEEFEILTSSTNDNIESFTLLESDEVSSLEWSEFTYQLPKDAKYFAIRYISSNKFGLLLDDISYLPVEGSGTIEIQGYNVYRDGEKITPQPIGEVSYLDAKPSVEEHTYTVSVVYDRGESLPSNVITISVQPSSIEAIMQYPFINTEYRTILIKGAEGYNLTIYTMDGKLITQSKATDEENISVEPGVYLINLNGKITKVIVK